MPFVKQKLNLPAVFGKAFMIAAIVELSAIIGGIYFIRKYNSDEEFRTRLENDHPVAMTTFFEVRDKYKSTFEEYLSPATQAKILSFFPSTTAEPNKTNDK